MNNINERLDNLKLEIQKPEFLEGKGLSNEVNIRIFCYDAQDEMIVTFWVVCFWGTSFPRCRLKV